MNDQPPDFEAFFRDRYPELIKVGIWACGNAHDAEEAVAAVVAALYFRWSEIIHPWSYARRSLLREINRVRSDPHVRLTVPMAPGDLPGVVDMCADLQAHETEEWVNQHLAGLPPAQRDVLRMFVLDDLSLKEIADCIGKSHSAVRHDVVAARRKLRAAGPQHWTPNTGTDERGHR